MPWASEYSYTGSPKWRRLSAVICWSSFDPLSSRGVAVRPICIAAGLRVSTSDQRPQAERWHSSMTMWLKWFSG